MSITTGSRVTLEFTMSVDGQTVTQADADNPLQYTHGDNEILPGLEAELEGLSTGDSKAVTLGPDDGYGLIDEALFREVELDTIPEKYRKEGIFLQQEKDDETVQFRVRTVNSDHIVLDFNHPFAGRILQFDVTIADVE